MYFIIFLRAASKEDSPFGALDCRGTGWSRCFPLLSDAQGKSSPAAGLFTWNTAQVTVPSIVLKTC